MTHTDRILRLLADGRPRSSGEIAEWLDLPMDTVVSVLAHLKSRGRARSKRVWHNRRMVYYIPRPKPPRQIAREPKDTGPEIPWRGEWRGNVLDYLEVRG